MQRIDPVISDDRIMAELTQPASDELGRLAIVFGDENPHALSSFNQSWSTLPSDLFSTILPLWPSIPISWTLPRCWMSKE